MLQLNQRHELEPCPACLLKATYNHFSCRMGRYLQTERHGWHVRLSAASLTDVSLPTVIYMLYPHYSNGSPMKELTRCLNCPESKVLQGLFFKYAWYVNLKMHKNGQILDGFTMYCIFCSHAYVHIYCKLFSEWRDDSSWEKTKQNIPPAPTFSSHEYLTTMQWKIKKDTKLLWKFKLSFLIQW